jgi:hypothetical protein
MSHFAEEIQHDLATGRFVIKESKRTLPVRSEQHKWVLLYRHYDERRDVWTEWEEITGKKLWENYGATVDEWKESCQRWIDIGATYQYKIIKRTDVEEWFINYKIAKHV